MTVEAAPVGPVGPLDPVAPVGPVGPSVVTGLIFHVVPFHSHVVEPNVYWLPTLAGSSGKLIGIVVYYSRVKC